MLLLHTLPKQTSSPPAVVAQTSGSPPALRHTPPRRLSCQNVLARWVDVLTAFVQLFIQFTEEVSRGCSVNSLVHTCNRDHDTGVVKQVENRGVSHMFVLGRYDSRMGSSRTDHSINRPTCASHLGRGIPVIHVQFLILALGDVDPGNFQGCLLRKAVGD